MMAEDSSKASVQPGGDGGLLDISSMTFIDLTEILTTDDLGRALDQVLRTPGTGHHGFNNYIS